MSDPGRGGRRAPLIGVGEALWDLFPDGPRLGGAPFNCCYHARALGLDAIPWTRVGDDDRGREIAGRAAAAGLDPGLIQVDPEWPTGTVDVSVGGGGAPAFRIADRAAWDRIAWDEQAERRVAAAAWICFGTLAQRHPIARATIRRCLDEAAPATRVCDLNLRPPHDDPRVVDESLRRCEILKLNDDEAGWLARRYGWPAAGAGEIGERVRAEFPVREVYVTLGADGCVAIGPDGTVAVPGERVAVVDTVGSGDAFTAALIAGRARGDDPATAARTANRLGAFVASCAGATPSIDEWLANRPPTADRTATPSAGGEEAWR